MRRDAVLNRQRILEGAPRALNERGLSCSMADIAHDCGIGLGTLYRHFPDRSVLIATLFERLEKDLVCTAASISNVHPDPVRHYMHQAAKSLAAKYSLARLFWAAPTAVDCARAWKSRHGALIAMGRQRNQLYDRLRAADIDLAFQLLVGWCSLGAPDTECLHHVIDLLVDGWLAHSSAEAEVGE